MASPKKQSPKRSPFTNAGIYLNFFYSLFTIGFLISIYRLQMLPSKYFIALTLILLIPWYWLLYIQLHKRVKKKRKMQGRMIMLVLIVVLGMGNWLLLRTDSFMAAITGANVKTTVMSVIVRNENKAESIENLKNGKFGVITTEDRSVQEKTIDDIRKQIDKEPATVSYKSYKDYGADLLRGNIDAIVLNEGARGLIEENHPEFKDSTRVLYQFKCRSSVEDISKNVKVTNTPFHVYISGIDVYGDISTSSRSDVNMMAAINPTTHQILLVSIPRDYYIPQPCQGNQSDKLTHSGIYGTDCTIQSFESYTDIELNYYARVNFTSLIDIVDALGGIDVDNPEAFTGEAGGFYFEEGDIHLSGEEALCFARERHSFIDEDAARGRNQMRVISSIIHKAASPTVITNFSGILNALQGSVETNMSQQEMSSLVKMQLNEEIEWDIKQISLGGFDNMAWSPANGFEAYVMEPSLETVQHAKALIDKLDQGDTITQEDITQQETLVEAAKYMGME